MVMPSEKLYEILYEHGLKDVLQKAFHDIGIKSLTLLQDDKKVQAAAQIAFEALPFPVRMMVNASMGEQGFYDLVFKVRLKVMEGQSIELSWLNKDSIKAVLVSDGQPGAAPSGANNQLNQPYNPAPLPPPQQAPLRPQSPPFQPGRAAGHSAAPVPQSPPFQPSASHSNKVLCLRSVSTELGAFVLHFPTQGGNNQTASAYIGRDPSQCQLVIASPSVSRVHARLDYQPGTGFFLSDRNSSNGTFVNGVRLGNRATLIAAGAQIKFGGFIMSTSLV
jgi:hypothetical protein